jgi:hypothetical protein
MNNTNNRELKALKVQYCNFEMQDECIVQYSTVPGDTAELIENSDPF